MLISKRWQSNTALMLAVGLTSAATLPLLTAVPASANSRPYSVSQLFPQQNARLVVPAGTVIPIRYEEAERIIVTPDETAEVKFVVSADIRSSAGTVLIPQGSVIEGELRPANGGTQFFAQEVILASNNQRYPIDATSNAITQTETISRRSNPNILRGAAIGAAAAAVLSEIFGRINVIQVLAGAGVGALAEVLLRGSDEVEVVVVNPETDLSIRLQRDFVR
ncbi:hypothetical protein IQ268_24215 [Oculatella sp. LEGE 06141]|uniref:hypothetical protein n=1 Tax=Oculatella sp. LEGE 06141 TaxID=1828648 RepID=UPI0018809302|nr:hypothetical protein [Oculatella sp. LEGE 06141]MBE9181674.1 hypothetical protein [Oculatella sp. LEGE 06141]